MNNNNHLTKIGGDKMIFSYFSDSKKSIKQIEK